MFSKRHYEWLARFWHYEFLRRPQERLSIVAQVRRMAVQLKDTNPLFNAKRFMTACGLTSEEFE
jgi:hypothetical protein